MIKFGHFNISLKLKQKYLFEKLYFFKNLSFLLRDSLSYGFQFIFIFPQEYLYPPVKMTLKESLYLIISYR